MLYIFLKCTRDTRLMNKYIFLAAIFLHIWWLEGALFDTQWRHDVSLKITSVIKQKNIISKNVTGLNGLLQSNYCMHWNINVTVIWGWMWWISSQWSKYWFWSYWEWSFLKYGRDRKYEPVEVRSDDDSDGKNICSKWTLPSYKR